MYFVTYTVNNAEKIEKFYTIEAYFEWLQTLWNSTGMLPVGMCVYHAKCVFDGS